MSDESSLEPAPVEVVGSYEILAEVGSDSVSRTYVAFDLFAPARDRYVLLRRIRPEHNRDDFLHMALDESEFLVRRLRAPYFVETLAIARSSAEVYIVSEYVPGERLSFVCDRAVAREERVPLGVALSVVLDVCRALAQAHSIEDAEGRPMNVVYRYLCPSSVLVGADGGTRLVPVVLPPGVERGEATRAPTRDERIGYVAPEQLRAGPESVAPAIDLFALGVIAWEVFTGRRLFTGASDVEVVQAIASAPIVTVRSVVPGVPEALDDAVMKALARDPADRHASCAEFAAALEEAGRIVWGPDPRSAVARYVADVVGARLEDDRTLLRVLHETALLSSRPGVVVAPPPAFTGIEAAGPYRGVPSRGAPEVEPSAPIARPRGLAALVARLRALLRRGR